MKNKALFIVLLFVSSLSNLMSLNRLWKSFGGKSKRCGNVVSVRPSSEVIFRDPEILISELDKFSDLIQDYKIAKVVFKNKSSIKINITFNFNQETNALRCDSNILDDILWCFEEIVCPVSGDLGYIDLFIELPAESFDLEEVDLIFDIKDLKLY